MSIYLCLLLISIILLSIRYSFIYKYYKHIIISIVFIILFVICVFRATSVGTDYNEYYSFFIHPYQELVISYVNTGIIEPGYAQLTDFAQCMNNFLIIPSIVFILGFMGVYLFCKEFNVNKFTSLSFFIATGLYFQMFTALRQMIALGISYIGIYLLLKINAHKVLKLLLFAFVIYIAMQFHKTAIFMIIFLILSKINYGKLSVIISGIVTLILFITGIAQRMVIYLIHMIPHYSTKYIQYGTVHISLFSNLPILCIESIPILCQFIFLYIFISKKPIKDTKTRFILSGYLLYLLLFAALSNNSVRRLQLYMLIFPILYSCLFLNSNYTNKLKYNISNSTKCMYILFWVLFYISKLLITDNSGLLPYHLINLSQTFYN